MKLSKIRILKYYNRLILKENLRVKVSRERFGIELTSILNDPNVFDALKKFYENDLWDIIFELPAQC